MTRLGANLDMSDLSNKPIRIVILDNHVLVRAGLRFIIESQPDLIVVGQAGNPNEAVSVVISSQPDIILLEYDPECGMGFDVFRELKNAAKTARMILVTGIKERQIYLQAVAHGVLGIVAKTQPPEVLLKSIRKVHQGEVWIEHSLIASIVTQSFHTTSIPTPSAQENNIQQLSDREREIIRYIGRGLKNKQIASQLCIAENTVRHHLTRIFSKLGVSDRLELLVYAQEHRLT
jgi:DNA-binding NarL/FixJ family response regulator